LNRRRNPPIRCNGLRRRSPKSSRTAETIPPAFSTETADYALQQHTGWFAQSFLYIPVLMVAMAVDVTVMMPEHSGKELNEIIV
jgi:hypothetical protein